MDHLKTPQERQERWYSKVRPRFLPVRDIAIEEENSDRERKKHQREWGASSFVNGIPFESIHHPKMKEHIKEQLNSNGFCVFTKVLSLEECNHGLDLVWDFIEAASAAERYIAMSKNDAIYADSPVEDTIDGHNDYNAGADDDNLCKSMLSLPPPIQRDNPSTHHKTKYFPRAAFGISQFYGSGHTQFMWFLRARPSIQTVFASLHNSILCDYVNVIRGESQIDTPKGRRGGDAKNEELATSLDGMVAWIEEEDGDDGDDGSDDDDDSDDNDNDDDHLKSKAKRNTDSGWFHIDQNPITKPTFESVQGLVNLLPVTEATGGNVLVRKSHLFFPHHYYSQNDKNVKNKSNTDSPLLFYEDRLKEIDGDDWLEIDPYDKELLDPENVIACMLNPGDVLIWDSRLVHCSYPACHDDVEKSSKSRRTKMSKESKSENLGTECAILSSLSNRRGLTRVAGLINMTTRCKVSNKTVSERKEAINRSRTLTHWVNKASPLGEERSQEVQIESACIEFIQKLQSNGERKVLLSYDDLTLEQQRLV